MLQRVSAIAKDYFKNISLDKNKLEIQYKSEVDISDLVLTKTKFKEKLMSVREKDIMRRYTSVGPHRDDIDIFIDEKSIKHYASQGQQRLTVICLKFAQRNILKKELGENPVLLLDDVMSELDVYRRRMIMENNDHQVFMTTTDLKFIPDDILKNSNLYRIRAGVLG